MEHPDARLTSRRPAWADLHTQAAANHGVLSVAEVLEAGVSPASVTRAVTRGDLVRLAPRVVAIPALLDDWSHLSALCRSTPGAVASHRSAARLLGLDGVEEDVVEVTVAGPGRPRRSNVHRSTDLAASDVTLAQGIPTTTATRTLCDLGAVCGPDVVEQALESALRLRTTSISRLHARCGELARRGRAGPSCLRALLARRDVDVPPTESALETLALQCLRAGGIPAPVRQHTIRDGSRFVARVDLAWPEARLYVELDGRAHHSSWGAQQRDLERQNRLTAAGWSPLRYTWPDVVHDAAGVVARTAAALAARATVVVRGAA